MTRTDVRTVRDEVMKAVETALAKSKTGLKFDVSIGNISFTTDGEMSFKMKLNAVSTEKTSNGETVVKKAGSDRNALLLGLPDNWYGTIFTMGGKKYKLVDLNPRAAKYPFVVERQPDGKRFKAPASCKDDILKNIK